MLISLLIRTPAFSELSLFPAHHQKVQLKKALHFCASNSSQGCATPSVSTTSTPRPSRLARPRLLREIKPLRHTLIVVVVVPVDVFSQRLLMGRTVAPAWACLTEQGSSYSSQAIVVVVVRRPSVANKWHFPSKRRNPELIDVVFSLFATKAKLRPNRATTSITGVGADAPCATTTMMLPRSKRSNYYNDCQCRSNGSGRLMLGTKRCPPCATDDIDRHREFGRAIPPGAGSDRG